MWRVKVFFSAIIRKSHFWELYKDIGTQTNEKFIRTNPQNLLREATWPPRFIGIFFQFETDGATRPARVGGLGGQNHQTVPATNAASASATTNGKRVSVLSKTVVHENKKNMENQTLPVPDETEEPLIEVLHEEEAAAVNSSNGHGNKTTVAVINATNVTNNGQVHETHL